MDDDDGHVVETIHLSFLQPDGVTVKTVKAKVGESFLQVAHRNDIDLEGACEGTSNNCNVWTVAWTFLQSSPVQYSTVQYCIYVWCTNHKTDKQLVFFVCG
jgi:hypothetical protein